MFVNKVKTYIHRLSNMGGGFPVEFAIDLILISLLNSYKQFVMNFHIKNLKVTLMELFDILRTEEANIVKKETLSSSKAIKTRNDLEKKMIYLLQENEKIVTEVFNQGLKRNVNPKIAPKHDLVEAVTLAIKRKAIGKDVSLDT